MAIFAALTRDRLNLGLEPAQDRLTLGSAPNLSTVEQRLEDDAAEIRALALHLELEAQ